MNIDLRRQVMTARDDKTIFSARNLICNGTNSFDTGFAAFSHENIDTDFKITMRISSFDTSTESNGVILGNKYEGTLDGQQWPGFYIRRQTSGQKLEIGGYDYYAPTISQCLNKNIYFWRESGAYKALIEGESEQALYVRSTVFDQNIIIGAGVQTSGTEFRYGKFTLDYIRIETYFPHYPSHNLPNEYQEVRYILGDATGAVIDTGIQPDQTTYAEFKFYPIATTGDVLLGTKGDSDSSDWRFFNYNNTIYWDCWSSRTIGASMPLYSTRELRVYNNGYLNLETEDGMSSDEISSFSVPHNIFINGGSSTMTAKALWYYVKIYKGGEMVRDFIPCYRKSDNECGLYDLVTNEFYYSAGSGSFIAGPSVD